jgi:hypothetical protein
MPKHTPITGADMPEPLLRAIKVPRHIDLLGPKYLHETAHRTNVVIVHCTIPADEEDGGYYINRHTFLLDHHARLRYRLLHAEGIAHEDDPDQAIKRHGRPLHFTLYFLGLAHTCAVFDLVERSDDPFPFIIRNVPRNAQDVYRVTFSQRSINDHTPKNIEP